MSEAILIPLARLFLILFWIIETTVLKENAWTCIWLWNHNEIFWKTMLKLKISVGTYNVFQQMENYLFYSSVNNRKFSAHLLNSCIFKDLRFMVKFIFKLDLTSWHCQTIWMTDSFPLPFNELSFSNLTPPFTLVRERHQTIHIIEKHFETITDEVLRITVFLEKHSQFFSILRKV